MANGSRGLVVIKIIASCFSSILLIGPPLSYLNPVDPNTQHPSAVSCCVVHGGGGLGTW